MRSHILRKSAYRIFSHIIAFLQSHMRKLCHICKYSHMFAHLHIHDRVFQHFCAFVQHHRLFKPCFHDETTVFYRFNCVFRDVCYFISSLKLYCTVVLVFVGLEMYADDIGQYIACVIYAAYFHNDAYMPHILHICRIFQRIFRQIPHIFPHILHQNGPHILRKISAISMT